MIIPDNYDKVLKEKMNKVTKNIFLIRDSGFEDLLLLAEIELSLHCLVEEAYYLGAEDGRTD